MHGLFSDHLSHKRFVSRALSQRAAEREAYVSTRTLRVFLCSGCSMSEVLDIIDPWLAFLMIVCSSVVTLALPCIVDLFSEREHDSF